MAKFKVTIVATVPDRPTAVALRQAVVTACAGDKTLYDVRLYKLKTVSMDVVDEEELA